MEDSKRERKGYVLILLLFLLLLVSIGYAFLTSSLKINGHSSIENARWDIHFANISSEKGVTPVKKATISKDGLYITYDVEFQKPGEYYEFTVDVVNDGTLDAKLYSTPTIEGLDDINKELYNYSVKWYDLDKTASVNDEILSSQSSRIIVRLELKKDITSEQFNNLKNNKLNISFRMNYVQA